MSWTAPISMRIEALKPSPTLAVDAKAKAMKAQGMDIVNLSAGEPDFDTPEHIKEAAIEAIRNGFTKYTAVGGIVELKQAIAARLERHYSVSYAEDEIMASTGGKQVLYNIFQAILDPGDEVIIPVPYWVSYPALVELAGGVPVYLQTEASSGFALDINAMKKLINNKTKAIILNSPSNPTGAAYAEKDLRAVAELAIAKKILVITDDIYDEIRFDERGPENILSFCPEARDNTIVANGVSKAYAMTGWRIGYLAGPAHIVKGCMKIQSQSTSNPNSIAQKASVAALSGPQECVSNMQEAFLERRNYIYDRLNAMPNILCVKPQGAFYVFPDISACYGLRSGDMVINGSLDFADYLLETAKIASVPGIAFGDDRFVRFSYATDIQTLETGMNRLEEALRSLE